MHTTLKSRATGSPRIEAGSGRKRKGGSRRYSSMSSKIASIGIVMTYVALALALGGCIFISGCIVICG